MRSHPKKSHLLPIFVKWLWKLTESHFIMSGKLCDLSKKGKPTVELGEREKNIEKIRFSS